MWRAALQIVTQANGAKLPRLTPRSRDWCGFNEKLRRSMLKPGGNNAAGVVLRQPGKKLPHDQQPLLWRPAGDSQRYDFPHLDSQRLAAACDRGLPRASGVVSSEPSASEQCGAGIG